MALLDGKVALVSGAGPGAGPGRGAGLRARGRDGRGRRPHRGQGAGAGGRGRGRRARRRSACALDITDAGQCRAAVERIVEAYGRLDVLVNNAFDDGDRTPFLDADLDRWRRTTEVNLFGTLQLTQAVRAAMVAQGDGRIVMVNSMSAVRIRPGLGRVHGVEGRRWRRSPRSWPPSWASTACGSTASTPATSGATASRCTSSTWRRRRASRAEEQYREVASETALGYLPHSSEIAEAVVFFASDMSKPITGQALGRQRRPVVPGLLVATRH